MNDTASLPPESAHRPSRYTWAVFATLFGESSGGSRLIAAGA
jgi:hypothetical protein